MASKKQSILEKTVYQSNPLIQAQKQMTVTGMRLFVLGLSQLSPHFKKNAETETYEDIEFAPITITYNQIQDAFQKMPKNKNSSNFKDMVKALGDIFANSYCVLIGDKNGKKAANYIHVYRTLEYTHEDGIILQFDDLLKPYLLDLANKAYTQYKLKNFFCLSSEYSWRILESLLEKQGFLKKGHKEIFVTMTIEEMRWRFNIGKKQYNQMCDFKKRVLDAPIKEINKKTDYIVRYDTIKAGRKVTGFTLYLKLKRNVTIDADEEQLLIQPPKIASNGQTIADNTNTPTIEEKPVETQITPLQAIKNEMIKAGLKDTDINAWCNKYNLDTLRDNWDIAKARAKHKNGDDKIVYLVACMYSDYATQSKKEQLAKEKEYQLEKEKQEELKDIDKQFKEHNLDIADIAKSIGMIKTDEQKIDDMLIKCGQETGFDSPIFCKKCAEHGISVIDFYENHPFMIAQWKKRK